MMGDRTKAPRARSKDLASITFFGAASLLAIVAATAAVPAFAQESGVTSTLETPGAPPSTSAPTSEATDDDGDEIVVTAMRTSSLASKTPVALTAVSGEGLRDAGITEVANLDELVPNLSIDRNNGLQITIRGVTSTDGTEKGDPSAAFLLDGIYLARPQAADVSFFDIERVEVLRGPQGTLYGRNSTAGVIHVISALPKHDFEASVDAQYGAFNQANVSGMVNVPVNEMIALRGAFNWDRRDSYIRRGAGGASLDPARNVKSGRLSALFDFSPDVRLVVRGDYSKMDSANGGSVVLANFFKVPDPLPFATNPVFNAIFQDQYLKTRNDLSSKEMRTMSWAERETDAAAKTWGIMAELTADLGFFDLTYLGSYREMHRRDRGSNPLNNVRAAGSNTFVGDYWQNSQELRLAFGDDGPFHGQIGAYYFKEQSGIAFFLQNFFFPGGEFGFPQDPTKAVAWAGFGQVTYDITPELHITGGIRYSHDMKSRIGATLVRDQITKETIPGFLFQENNAKRTFSKTTWRLGVDYDAPGLGLLYATVSTGYKAGGFNDGCEQGTPDCPVGTPGASVGQLYFDPETLTAYEAGFKIRLLDNMVRLNGSLFHYDYQGLQLSSVGEFCGPGTLCQLTTNAGKAKVDGVELESTIQPSDMHRIDLGINYLAARYTEFFPTPGVSFEGIRLDRSPKWTGFAGYTLTVPISEGNISASARTRFSGKYLLTELATRAHFVQDSFHKTDLTITYTAPEDRWYVQGFVRNLEDKVTISTATAGTGGPGNGNVGFLDPRTYGVRAGVRF